VEFVPASLYFPLHPPWLHRVEADAAAVFFFVSLWQGLQLDGAVIYYFPSQLVLLHLLVAVTFVFGPLNLFGIAVRSE